MWRIVRPLFGLVLLSLAVLETVFLFVFPSAARAQGVSVAALSFTCFWAVLGAESSAVRSRGLWASIAGRLVATDLYTFDQWQLATCFSLAVSVLTLFAL